MRRVSTIRLIVASLLFTHFPTHAGDARDLHRNDADRIDAMIQVYDRPDAPGISVIVIKDRMVLYKKAYGLADVEARVTNTTNTNFRLASVTKQFTAMAILILMERGKLSLESHLADFFPDFPAYGREITIRQLLNHTSGLPDYAALMPADQKEQLSDEDVLRILKQPTKGNFRPGSKFEYSNSGYVVLGLIAAKVSGKSFARFLEESIFQPLGMSSTVAYEPGISTVKNRAYGYTPVREDVPANRPEPDERYLGGWRHLFVRGRLVSLGSSTEHDEARPCIDAQAGIVSGKLRKWPDVELRIRLVCRHGGRDPRSSAWRYHGRVPKPHRAAS